jgi:Signal transduction histidine kinase, nitrogen specific
VPDSERELTSLICEETDRIVALVDRMEAFADGGRSSAARSTSTRC